MKHFLLLLITGFVLCGCSAHVSTVRPTPPPLRPAPRYYYPHKPKPFYNPVPPRKPAPIRPAPAPRPRSPLNNGHNRGLLA